MSVSVSTLTTTTIPPSTANATKFKVVEFYRNNNRALVSRNGEDSSSSSSSAAQLSSNNLYDLLGFEIIGGYLADVPATIVNVATNAAAHNRKEVKVSNLSSISIYICNYLTKHYILNHFNYPKILDLRSKALCIYIGLPYI